MGSGFDQNSDSKFDPKRDFILIKILTQSLTQTGSRFDQNSDPKFDPNRDLILIKILPPKFDPKLDLIFIKILTPGFDQSRIRFLNTIGLCFDAIPKPGLSIQTMFPDVFKGFRE